MNTSEKKTVYISARDGETFMVDGMEFIKFPDVNGMTPVVSKDILFNSSFGSSPDLQKSKILRKLERDILPRIIKCIGEENVHAFETDLTTLDGLKPYGTVNSRISIPTMDFYRKNVEIFDKYKPDRWWWLATPESAAPHYNSSWVLCVSPSGNFYDSHYISGGGGVRPFLYFNSSIFGSSEE